MQTIPSPAQQLYLLLITCGAPLYKLQIILPLTIVHSVVSILLGQTLESRFSFIAVLLLPIYFNVHVICHNFITARDDEAFKYHSDLPL